MSAFRVADLDLETRSPEVALPARFPRIEELSFRLKAVRRHDVSCLLQLYWLGVKWLMIPCSDGADVIRHAARLLESAEQGVWPFSPLHPGLTFALRFDPRSMPGLQSVRGLRNVDFLKWTGHFWDEINRHWSIPKGKVDAGESDEDAALREVEEETAVTAALVRELATVRYTDHRGRSKRVRYWQMRVVDEGELVPSDEVDEARWLPLDEAVALLTYDHDRALLDLIGGR